MPWLLTMLVAVAGVHFAEELAGLLPLAPVELRLILAGTLLGLGVAFVMSELGSRSLARRQRHTPHLCDMGAREKPTREKTARVASGRTLRALL